MVNNSENPVISAEAMNIIQNYIDEQINQIINNNTLNKEPEPEPEPKPRSFGQKSLFSQRYSYTDLKKRGLLKNKLYFSMEKNITNYTKKMDDTLFRWLEQVLNKKLRYNIDRDVFLTKQDYKEAVSVLTKGVLRCTKEILYNKIYSNLNIIDKTKLQCMGAASLGLAAKTILEFDWYIEFEDGLFKHLADWTGKSCSVKQLKKMEIDLFKTTDFSSCKKVLQRIYDRHGLFKKEYIEPVRRKSKKSGNKDLVKDYNITVPTMKKKRRSIKKKKKQLKIHKSCNPKNRKSSLKEYICNPISGRWVLKKGKIGRSIL
jgi:hypothetical protein